MLYNNDTYKTRDSGLDLLCSYATYLCLSLPWIHPYPTPPPPLPVYGNTIITVIVLDRRVNTGLIFNAFSWNNNSYCYPRV